MENDTPNTQPRLAPPGAGLPKPELWIARLIFGWFRKTRSHEAVTALFEKERDVILGLAKNCGAEAGARRILIHRLPGLEDSSRNWSVFMTLEHLRIVNEAVAATIGSLTAGRVPPGVASTAAVKPAPGIDERVIETFTDSCADFLKSIETNLQTPVRHAHPWFGPLDAAGWHAMAAFHMRLHRKQVEKIIAGRDALKCC